MQKASIKWHRHRVLAASIRWISVPPPSILVSSFVSSGGDEKFTINLSPSPHTHTPIPRLSNYKHLYLCTSGSNGIKFWSSLQKLTTTLVLVRLPASCTYTVRLIRRSVPEWRWRCIFELKPKLVEPFRRRLLRRWWQNNQGVQFVKNYFPLPPDWLEPKPAPTGGSFIGFVLLNYETLMIKAFDKWFSSCTFLVSWKECVCRRVEILTSIPHTPPNGSESFSSLNNRMKENFSPWMKCSYPWASGWKAIVKDFFDNIIALRPHRRLRRRYCCCHFSE